MHPLKLFWWNAEPNFGDYLSKYVVAHISKREVIWSSEKHADLFAIGSIMWNVRKAALKDKTRSVHVWGTGCMKPINTDFTDNVKFHAVRGPITAGLVNIKTTQQGDPGILVSDFIEVPKKSETIGIVPHHSSWNDEKTISSFRSIAEHLGAILIDVRTEDSIHVCQEIGKCRAIFSESLHGAIVSDSFGIPNLFISPDSIHKFPYLKWHDYSISIGRPWGKFVDLSEIETIANKIISMEELPYQASLTATKNALRKAFPQHLIAS